jgi:hypothetical protein
VVVVRKVGRAGAFQWDSAAVPVSSQCCFLAALEDRGFQDRDVL